MSSDKRVAIRNLWPSNCSGNSIQKNREEQKQKKSGGGDDDDSSEDEMHPPALPLEDEWWIENGWEGPLDDFMIEPEEDKEPEGRRIIDRPSGLSREQKQQHARHCQHKKRSKKVIGERPIDPSQQNHGDATANSGYSTEFELPQERHTNPDIDHRANSI